MKKILILMLAIAGVLYTTSCLDDNEETTLTLSEKNITFKSNGGEQLITVTSNEDWTVESDSWIKVTKQETKIVLKVAPNKTFEALTGVVKITAGELVKVIKVTQEALVLDFPLTNFGATYEEIIKQEKERGFTVTEKKELRQLWASKEKDNIPMEFVYYFDEEGKFKLAESHISDENMLTKQVSLLISKYKLEKKELGSSTEDMVKLFSNEDYALSSYVIDDKYGFVIGMHDDSNNSWMRQTLLKDSTTNIWMPILGKSAPQITMELFEYAQGHTLNEELTKKDNGVFVFDTYDSRFPNVKYWFDLKEKSFLEESAIFINPENRPSPVEIDNWLKQLGFKKTIVVDGNQNPIYFHKENKCIALVEMNKPKDESASFEPKIQFFFGDLEDKLPAENIQMPMPVLSFNKLTMKEAVEEYKKESYFVSYSENAYGVMINTNSPDFKGILIMEDGGKYAMAFVLAETIQIINSPEIPEILIENGFEEKKVGPIPTFINKDKDVMAQIDTTGAFGSYSVAFSKNEY